MEKQAGTIFVNKLGNATRKLKDIVNGDLRGDIFLATREVKVSLKTICLKFQFHLAKDHA